MVKFFSRLDQALILLTLCSLPISALANDVSIDTSCNPCTVGEPVAFTPAACTPTPTPTATPTRTPTRTPTPIPTATPTPYICTDYGYVNQGPYCKRNCVRRTCNGAVVSDVCGGVYGCNYCRGVGAYYQCGCSAGIVAGYHSVAGRVNYYIYGADGATICYSESCLRCNKSFDPHSQISLADGSTKEAKDLTVEDQLLSPDGKAVKIKEIVQSDESAPLIAITVGEQVLKVTQGHLVWTPSGLVKAEKLKKGDLIKVASGETLPIDKVEELPIKLNQQAYGICLDVDEKTTDDRLLIGDGIVVGDYVLERRLADSK